MKKIFFILSILCFTIMVNAQAVTTFAGSTSGNVDGTGTAAQFSSPKAACTDTSGNIYVSDGNNAKIRKITTSGVVTTLASGFASGVCVDAAGNVYTTDHVNNIIEKISPTGVVNRLAGWAQHSGYQDGPGTSARFYFPRGICVDASGNVYVTDEYNHKIRKITPSGVVSTFAGSSAGYADGIGVAAKFSYPYGICIDGSGNLYVADANNNRIRKITQSGVVTTLAGSGVSGYIDGIGTAAAFSYLKGICVDASGNIYVTEDNKIRKITPTGVVTTFVGSSTSGYVDGTGTAAQFNQAYGVCKDLFSGNLYVADSANNRIRKITFCNASNSPVVNITPSTNATICPGQNVTLSASGGVNYSWSSGQNTGAITVNPTQTTTYTVTASNSNGCTSTTSSNVTVYPISITIAGSNTICYGQSTTLTASGASSYLWSNGSTSSSITVNPSVTSTYTVIGTNTFGCNATSSKIITVNSLPVVTLSSPTALTCSQFDTPLQASVVGTDVFNYLWSNGSTNNFIYATPSINGSTYSVTVTNSLGCSTTTSSGVFALIPTPIITPVNPTICIGQSINLIASGGSTYQWSNGLTTSSISVSPTVNTTYSVNVISPAGCTASTTKTVSIYSTPSTNISADGVVAASTIINNGSSVQLQLNGSFNAVPNVQWTPATGISSTTVSNPIVYPSTTTTYTASFTNSNGCQQSTSFVVNVNPQSTIGTLSLTSPSSAAIGLFDTITVDIQLTGATNLYSLFMKLKGNAAVNQYLDYSGHTAGTLLGTNIISTPPTVTNGVPDFGMTKVGAVPGYSGSGLFYTLQFKPKNISIPSGTVFCFYLDDVSAYNSSGITCGLNNQGPICFTFTNQVAVWPGDLNKSNTVTTADILPIGYFYNSTGAARANATIQWNAQPATLWGYNRTSTNSDAYKVFADSNGDGVINNADQAAIGFNMNQVHNRMAWPTPDHFSAQAQQTLAVGTLTVTPNSTVINGAALPQTVTFTVSVNNTGGLNALYGISVNLLFDQTVFDLSTATVDYTGSIFGNAGSDCLALNYNSDNTVSVGLTRFGNAPINGQGLLFKVTLQTKTTLPNLTQTPVTAYVDAANNQAGDTLVIQDAPATNFTIINNLGLDTIKQEEFVLYPNPVNDILMIKSSTIIYKISVYNTLGQLLISKNENSKEFSVDLASLSNGNYFIRLESNNKNELFKIVKM